MKSILLSLAVVCAGSGLKAMDRDLALSLAQLTAASVGGQVYTVADTGSMKPALTESSIIVAEPIDISKIKAGDVVIFRRADQSPVVHRVIRNKGELLIVKGDANSRPDSDRVTSDNLIGRVCASF